MHRAAHKENSGGGGIYSSPVPVSGVKGLAITVFFGGIVGLNSANAEIRSECESWILSEDNQWLYSFLTLCDILHLEPNAVRNEVLGRNSILGLSLDPQDDDSSNVIAELDFEESERSFELDVGI